MHTKTLTERGGFRKQSVLELDNHFVGVDDIELAAQQFADHVGIGMVRIQQCDAVLQRLALRFQLEASWASR